MEIGSFAARFKVEDRTGFLQSSQSFEFGHQPPNVVVHDMAPVLAQVCRNAVRAAGDRSFDNLGGRMGLGPTGGHERHQRGAAFGLAG